MQIKQNVIQTAYHFFGEGILLMLLLGPFFHYTFGEISYWLNLASILAVLLIFSLLTQFTNKVLPYLLFTPFIWAGYFFILDFTLFLSILISAILTWRYILLRGDSYLENENKYLLATTILVIFYILIAKENSAILYLFIQFFVIMFGYIMNHTLAMQDEKKGIMTLGLGKVFFSLLILLVASMGLLHLFGVPALFIFWDAIVVNAWSGLALLVAYIGVGFMYVLQFIINLFPVSDEGIFDGNSGDFGIGDGENLILPASDIADFKFGPIFIILLVILLLYLAFKVYRKRFEEEAVSVDASVTHTSLEERAEKSGTFMARLRQKFFSRPNEPIRKVIFQFERHAEKRSLGRRPYETVNEWFSRIGLDVDPYAYEKVRYGNGEASAEEVQQLSQQLKMNLTRRNHDAKSKSSNGKIK